MVARTKKHKFGITNNWFLLAPLVTFIVGLIIQSLFETYVLFYFESLSILLLIVLYIAQSRQYRAVFTAKKIRHQLYLLIISLIVPFVALSLGDYNGSKFYGTQVNGIKSDINGGLGFGLFLIAVFLYVFLLGNALYLKTKAHRTGYIQFSKFAYGVGYFFVAAMAWFIYSLEYSAHDPNSE